MERTDPYPHLDIRYLVRAIARHLWLIIGLTGGAFVGVYLLSSMQTPVYSAVAEVRIIPAPRADGTTVSNNDDPSIMGNEIYIIRSPTVREQVTLILGPDKMREVGTLAVGTIPDTDVLRIKVSSTSPELARDAANAYATAFRDLRQEERAQSARAAAANLQAEVEKIDAELTALAQQIDAAGGPGAEGVQGALLEQADLYDEKADLKAEIRELERQADVAAATVSIEKSAGLPPRPDSPTPLRDAGVAAAIAFVFSIGLAFLLEQLDNRIKSADQIERAAPGVPVLGSIPYSGGRRPSKFRSIDRELVAPTSPAAEAYRTLATSLRFSSLGKEKRVILVTSSSGGEGKTTVTANLAAVLAESGLRVVVVSADLRRPMLGSVLHVNDTEKGLTSAMLGDDDLSSCFVSVPLPSGRSLLVLPAGPLPHEPAVLLGSDMFGTVLDRIKRAGADFILVDCAPVLPVSDPLAASRHVDGVIVMALHNKTRQQSLAETLERLDQVDAEVIGVVLNGVPAKSNLYGYYGYRTYERKEPPTPKVRSAPATSSNGAPPARRSEPTLAKGPSVASGDNPGNG